MQILVQGMARCQGSRIGRFVYQHGMYGFYIRTGKTRHVLQNLRQLDVAE